MSIKIRMCNRYFRDKVQNRGWDHVNTRLKIRNFIVTLWFEKTKLIMILFGKYHYMRQVDLVLTTKCSLNCKDCANLMPYYKTPYDVELNVLKKSIDNLLNKIDELNIVVMVGGEPFLYKDILDILAYVVKFKKVNYVYFFTNGTIVPKENITSVLQHPKVKIILSNYGEISRKRKDLKKYCEENHINFYDKKEDLYWGYVGNMNPRHRTSRQLSRQFIKCYNLCRSILNGKLFYCPRAAHGDDLGYINTPDEEYIDLLHEEDVTTEKIMKLAYSNHFYQACDYCNYGTKEMIPVTPGVQIRK